MDSKPYCYSKPGGRRLDINNSIVAKMELLTPEEFEGMLRPVFKEDEPTLILVGAALGFLIGELQVHVML